MQYFKYTKITRILIKNSTAFSAKYQFIHYFHEYVFLHLPSCIFSYKKAYRQCWRSYFPETTMASSLGLPKTHSLFKPIGCQWNDAKDLLPNFEDCFSSIFSNMLCCAICGSTKLINKSSITHMNTKAQNVFGTVLGCT
jgi:hypothetical protein